LCQSVGGLGWAGMSLRKWTQGQLFRLQPERDPSFSVRLRHAFCCLSCLTCQNKAVGLLIVHLLSSNEFSVTMASCLHMRCIFLRLFCVDIVLATVSVIHDCVLFYLFALLCLLQLYVTNLALWLQYTDKTYLLTYDVRLLPTEKLLTERLQNL